MMDDKEIKGIKDDIKSIIKSNDSTLSQHDEDHDLIYFSTRENGDVGEEHHSDIDYNDAYNIRKIIDGKYHDKISSSIETVGEFVHLNIQFN